MDFGIFFTNVGPFVRPEPFAHLVETAERVGFESAWTIEHVVIPVGYQARYPYDPSGKIPIPENADISDPLLPLAFAAARTTTLKLGTGVVILPQRHPLYIAKEAATLDVLSGGRLLLGVGIGWLREEFDALDIPFEERAPRTEETIRAMRSLWKAEPEAFEGQFFSWGPLEMNPSPVQPGGVPIVIGGHVPAAARRAARFGDGFFPAVFQPQQLHELLPVMRDECGKIGRDPKEIDITVPAAGTDLDLFHTYEDMGVARVIIGYGLDAGSQPSQIDAYLEGFAEAVIQKL